MVELFQTSRRRVSSLSVFKSSVVVVVAATIIIINIIINGGGIELQKITFSLQDNHIRYSIHRLVILARQLSVGAY